MSSARISRRRFTALGAGAAAYLALGGCANEDTGMARPIVKETVAYGTEPMQQGELRTQLGVTGQAVVVLIHGGYWKVPWDRSAMDPLAEDLSRRGWATWNIDYRRVGDPGGGWPGTFEDVAHGIDFLAVLQERFELDLDRVAVLGHSAGSQLAFWAAARKRLQTGAVGASPAVVPTAAISLSGVLDLAQAAAAPTGPTAELAESTVAVLGGAPGEVPGRYGETSPIQLVPLGIPQLLLHGSGDDKVPPSQSSAYRDAANAAGDRAELIELPEVDHFDVIRRDHVWWTDVITWLPERFGAPS